MLKSPFKKRKAEDSRILMLYPNIQMSGLMPQSIGIFTSILKQEGYKLDLFDCTFYQYHLRPSVHSILSKIEMCRGTYWARIIRPEGPHACRNDPQCWYHSAHVHSS